MKYYFDTCAYVKLLHEENGSGRVEQIFNDNSDNLVFSRLLFTEVYSTLYKKFRHGEITDENIVSSTLNGFERDMQYELVVELDESIFLEASQIIKKYGAEQEIKTYDALHLATCSLINRIEETTMVSSDKNLCKIAVKMGIEYLNIEEGIADTY